MRRYFFLVTLFIISSSIAHSQQQRDPVTPDMIDVEGSRSGSRDREPTGRAGGADGSGRTVASPGTSRSNPNAPGKKTTSQQCKQETDEALEAYKEVDFIPGTKTQIMDKLKELRDDAGRDGRTADKKYLDGIIENMSNGIDLTGTIAELEKITFVKLLAPDITHNILIRTPMGQFNGMRIVIPGYIKNAMGKRSELVVRFYLQNGSALVANIQEPYFRDINNLVIVGTGVKQIEDAKVDTEEYTLYIPYYALNFYPAGGTRTYNITAKASVYLDNKLVSNSPLTAMFVNY